MPLITHLNANVHLSSDCHSHSILSLLRTQLNFYSAHNRRLSGESGYMCSSRMFNDMPAVFQQYAEYCMQDLMCCCPPIEQFACPLASAWMTLGRRKPGATEMLSPGCALHRWRFQPGRGQAPELS